MLFVISPSVVTSEVSDILFRHFIQFDPTMARHEFSYPKQGLRSNHFFQPLQYLGFGLAEFETEMILVFRREKIQLGYAVVSKFDSGPYCCEFGT